MLGTRVGSYEITERLAEGGMGAVFVATHAGMDREAIVKLLRPELSNNADMIRRFLNEARAAAAIEDPGIVQIFDSGVLPDHRAYIVMERLRGETLGHRLSTGRMSNEHTVQILRLLARTLDAAHARQIVHRDLKPDNIFLVPDRDVPGGERTKILDFGIAKLADNPGHLATRAGTVFGTPAYMAPEQCSDSATVDARADLYALGCIAYEMLSGTPPFGLGGIELLACHLRDEPVALQTRTHGVPDALAAIVHRLLRKKPGERFQSSAELHRALQGVPTEPLQRSDREAGVAETLPPDAPSVVAISIDGPPARPRGAFAPASSGDRPDAAPPSPTTQAGAAGMVSGTVAAPRSKTSLALAGIAVVAVVAMVVVVATRDRDRATPDVTNQPAATPAAGGNPLADAMDAVSKEQWAEAITTATLVRPESPDHPRARAIVARATAELANLARHDDVASAVARTDLPAAREVASRIPLDSVYRARVDQLIADAEPKVPDEVSSLPGDHKPQPPRDAKRRPAATADAGRVASVATAKPGHDESIAQARRDVATKQFASALRHAKAALAASPGNGEALMIATIASCALDNADAARAYLPKGGTWREVSISRCKSLGISFD